MKTSEMTLCDEPFASAMAALGPTTIERGARVGERLLALQDTERHRVTHSEFGWSQLWWVARGAAPGDPVLAWAYTGEVEADFELLEDGQDPFAVWAVDGPLLRKLHDLGHPAADWTITVASELRGL